MTSPFPDQFENSALGFNGSTYVASTSNTVGTFCCIQTLSDTVFASMTARGMDTTPTGITISAGTFIYGLFSQFQLTSGSVLAYKFPSY